MNTCDPNFTILFAALCAVLLYIYFLYARADARLEAANKKISALMYVNAMLRGHDLKPGATIITPDNIEVLPPERIPTWEPYYS